MGVLHQLQQQAESGLGVEEGHHRPMGALPRSFVNEAHTHSLEFRHCGVDIFHLQGQMVEPFPLVFQKLGHRAVRSGGQK